LARRALPSRRTDVAARRAAGRVAVGDAEARRRPRPVLGPDRGAVQLQGGDDDEDARIRGPRVRYRPAPSTATPRPPATPSRGSSGTPAD
jgi:hypothetical protein